MVGCSLGRIQGAVANELLQVTFVGGKPCQKMQLDVYMYVLFNVRGAIR